MIEDNIINKEENERTVLVGLVTQKQSESKVNEYLDELDFLARTAGAEPEKTIHPEARLSESPDIRGHRQAGRNQEICGR